MTHWMKLPAGVLLGVIAFSFSGCVTPEVAVTTPDGFARFDEAAEPSAISPDGVVLHVRLVANRPAQDLEFWAIALERQMVESGYIPVGDGSFTSPGGDGRYFEWLAPVGEDDWIYLTALTVAEEQIIIAEAAGRFDLYEKRREAIIDALGTLTLASAR